jgi:6-pyruvoyltetrahydropterin/6-carboxytetrahydropterin synthase
MIYITRREVFNAAHRVFKEDWSDDKNLEVYGKCSNPNWHGHNYILYVTIKGDIQAGLGYVADLKSVSAIIRDKIIEKIDHKNINLEVSFMKGRIPSTENIAVSIWEELEAPIRKLGAELHCIKLEETENNFVEYYGA